MRQTDYVILGLLSEAPLSGYAIKKIVDLRFRFFWSESFGQIFPALRALPEGAIIVAEGISCRQQFAHGTGRRAHHLAEVLRESLAPAP